jgi:hypothetical protein
MAVQDPRGMTGEDVEFGPELVDGLAVRPTVRRLQLAGLTADEAANLTARLAGLRVGRSPWTVREVERLLFIRILVERGRLTP